VISVCPTPIGNLEDVTLRVLAVLGAADVVACEDTRHTAGLLARHGVRARSLVSLHEHNERARSASLVARASGGEHVAVVSDAGMPGVSDPGWVLVRDAIAAGVPVTVLPGASAAVCAVVASGLPIERWGFGAFLPRRRGELVAAFAGVRETTVFYESPRRLVASLAVLAEVDGERPVAVCRELTKVHEEVVRGPAAHVHARYAGGGEVRGEVALVVGAADAAGVALGEAVAAVRALVDAGARARPAAGVVAGLTGVPANALYRALQEG
jgi:16S rRNA (cytidine1402-2'-O)-methyltransferase